MATVYKQCLTNTSVVNKQKLKFKDQPFTAAKVIMQTRNDYGVPREH